MSLPPVSRGVSCYKDIGRSPVNHEKLVCLDREFTSSPYEAECGYSPETKITKTEGTRTAATIPLFSAGASSVESKSYSVFTAETCRSLMTKLEQYPQISECNHDFGSSSSICWISGVLTIDKVEVKRRSYTMTLAGKPKEPNPDEGERLVAEEYYFAVQSDSEKVALIPTGEYFLSGIAAFKVLIDTVVGPIELPIKALVRTFSAQANFTQWMGVPLVMVEP